VTQCILYIMQALGMGDLNTDGMIILKLIVNKFDVTVQIGFSCQDRI
jgi:hypothetical protein